MQSPAMSKKSMVGPAIAVGLAGVVAGVVAGILFAPKSGKETRDDLAKLANRMRDDITERMKKLSRITSTAYQEVVNNVVKQYEDAKEITKDQAQELKQEFGKSYDKVKRATEDETGNTTQGEITKI